MRNQNNLIVLVVFKLSLLSLIQFACSQLPEQLHIIGGFCAENQTVASKSAYSNNIHSVVANLTSLSSVSKFSNFSTGLGSNRVSGLYVCRPDLSQETCHACVKAVVKDLLTHCKDRKVAYIWYDECMVRYANRSIVAIEEVKPIESNHATLNVSNPEVFPDLLNRTMEVIIAEAVSPTNKFRFATGKANFTIFEGLYGMVWCTPDITPKRCHHCLTTALASIPSCCGGILSGPLFFCLAAR